MHFFKKWEVILLLNPFVHAVTVGLCKRQKYYVPCCFQGDRLQENLVALTAAPVGSDICAD
jgi:hypothetical protein